MIPLLEPLGYDGMNDFGDEILPGTETGQDRQKSIHKDLYKAIEISDWEITWQSLPQHYGRLYQGGKVTPKIYHLRTINCYPWYGQDRGLRPWVGRNRLAKIQFPMVVV